MAIRKLFIKTTDELKEYAAVYVSLAEDTMNPYYIEAQEQFVKPLLGDYFTTILDVYDAADSVADIAEDKDKELVIRIQRAVANLGLLLALPMLNVKLSEHGGILVESGNSYAPASQWRIDDLKKSLHSTGYAALDSMLEYLEAEKDYFTVWAGDSVYSELNKYFIASAKEFNKHFYIASSRALYLKMVPIIARVEQFDIKPEIGADYFAELKTKILAGTANSDDNAVLELLRPALANLSMSSAIDELQVEISSSGILVTGYAASNDNNRTAERPAPQALLRLRETSRTHGETYLKMLKEHLDANASASKYATYFGSDEYADPDDAPSTSFNNDEDTKVYNF